MEATDPIRASIPDSTLEFVPEQIARENCILPLSVDENSITLFCPNEPDFCARQEAKLRFIFDRAIIWKPVDRQQLLTAIDFHFSGLTNVLNCPPAFRFRCPQLFRNLIPTETEQVRFCDICDKLVFHCSTYEEATRLGGEGKCIAYRDSGAETVGMIEFEDDQN